MDGELLGSFGVALLGALQLSNGSECLRSRQLLRCSEETLPGVGRVRKWAEVELAQYLIDSVELLPGGEVDVQIVSSWAVVLSAGEWSPPGSDAGAGDLSGALFVQCPPTGCATTFDDPRALKFVGSPEYMRALGNNAKADMAAASGMAMIFPSYLERYTPPVQAGGGESLQVHFTATVVVHAVEAAMPLVVSFANSTAITTEAGAATHPTAEVMPSSVSMRRTELWATTITTVISASDKYKRLLETPPVPSAACIRPARGQYADSAGIQPLAALPETLRSMLHHFLETHIRNTIPSENSTIVVELAEVWVSTVSLDAEERRAACSRFAHADVRGVFALGSGFTIALQDPRQAARLTDTFGSADSILEVPEGSAVVFPAWLRSAYVHSPATIDTPVVHFNSIVRISAEGERADDDQSAATEMRVTMTDAQPEQSSAAVWRTIDGLPTASAQLSQHKTRVEWDWGIDIVRVLPPRSKVERAWMKPFAELASAYSRKEQNLFAQREEVLMGVGMARKWAEAALQTYLVEQNNTDDSTVAKILSSWSMQVCPDEGMLSHLSNSEPGSDITGLLVVRGCGITDCHMVLDDPRPRAVASSEGLAREAGYGSSTVVPLVEAGGVLIPSWIERHVSTGPVADNFPESVVGSDLLEQCGLVILFTAAVDHTEPDGSSDHTTQMLPVPSLSNEDEIDTDEHEDNESQLHLRRRLPTELVRNAWSTPFTRLSPSRGKRKQRAKIVAPLQQTILEMVSQFPSGRNSNRGGWQLPQRTLLEAADHGYPGVEWAQNLIRTAIEAHLLELLAKCRSHVHVASSGVSNGNTGPRKRGGVAVVKIGSSWANVNYASDHWNLPHVHISEELTSDLSGALYVHCSTRQLRIAAAAQYSNCMGNFDFSISMATK